MRKLLLYAAAVSLATFALVGCATRQAEQPAPTPLNVVQEDNITHLISTGKPLEAIQNVTAMQRSGNSEVPTGKLQELLVQAKAKVAELFKQAVAAQDYRTAYSLYRSAGLYEKNPFPNWSTGKLELDLAESYKKRGIDIPALLTFRRALNDKADVGPVIKSFGDLALEQGDRPVLSDIVKWLSSNGKPVPKDYTHLLGEKVKPSSLVPGVVTIWVNRGIKMENGIGVPDRVIGSGFFIDRQGYIITNYHVIKSQVDPRYEGFSRLYVMLYNHPNTRIPAKVVGYDKVFDLALLKVEVTPSVVLSFSSVNEFQPGDQIFAIGSPGGLSNTITSGIISAVGRRFLQMGDALQVDVPVNPGNSGGPLLNFDSQLVGVVFAGIPQFQGINFAIPAHWLKKLLPQLYAGGEISHPWIGAALQKTSAGLVVSYVLPDSPASHAGLKEGDVIVSVDGKKYSKVVDVQNAILSDQPGSLVRVTWKNDGADTSGLIALGKRPYLPMETALNRDLRHNLFPALFGMKVEETGSFLWRKSYRITKVYPGSVADETGLSVGDPITINGWHVDTQNETVSLQFTVERQKEGFLKSEMQIGASLKVDNFI